MSPRPYLTTPVPDITFALEYEKGPVSAVHAATPLDLSQIPYSLGGSWSFKGNESDQCTAAVGWATVTMDCANHVKPLVEVFQPYDMKAGAYVGRGTFHGTEPAHAPGDLRRARRRMEDLHAEERLPRDLRGRRLDASCVSDMRWGAPSTTTVSLTFEDGIASGTSNLGALSARVARIANHPTGCWTDPAPRRPVRRVGSLM